MKPLICTITILSAFALSSCKKPIAKPTSEPSEEEDSKVWSTTVLDLFSLDLRDEALQKLLSEAQYSENPLYTEESAGRIKEVVICPQSNSLPLIAVFCGNEHEPSDVTSRSGHFIIVRSDGVIIPFYRGYNSLDGYFSDLNGDGIMDYIDSIGQRVLMTPEDVVVQTLHVVPITEQFDASLVLCWNDVPYEWRLYQPYMKRIPTIQLGNRESGSFKVVAEYVWSIDDSKWIGPEGSSSLKFIRSHNSPAQDAHKLFDHSQN